MIEHIVSSYLADRNVAIGDTVQLGWLIFRVASVGPRIVLESLDFKNMASFTADLSEAESVYRQQKAKLEILGVEEETCNLQNYAIVSRSYEPGHPSAFIKRDAALNGNSSGWYVGVSNDPLDMNDENSFLLKSLYEIAITDRRTIPYWLMPVNTVVHLGTGQLDLS